MIQTILSGLGQGLPHLISQFLVTLAMVGIGVELHTLLTPFKEHELVVRGNLAAGVMLTGSILGMAIPLSAILLTSSALLDIIIWGAVAIVLQLGTFGILSLIARRMRDQIESGNVAVALPIVATQVAVALLNAAAVAG